MYLNSFVGVRCEILPKVLALWCFHLSGPASWLPDVCVFPKLFCNYVLFTFIIISSDYRCFHFTRICLVLLSSWTYFHKIEDTQRGNEAISGNCEIDRSVLFLLWASAPLSLFTLWPSPENSSLVSQYNLISRTRKIDDSTTETANIRKATCTTSNDFACNPNASNIWLIGK